MKNQNLFIFLILSVIVVVICASYSETSNPCLKQKKKHGYVCMCNENYCDTLDVPEPTANNDYVLVTTSKNNDRFAYRTGTFEQYDFCCKRNKSSMVTLDIDLTRKYQQIKGFGGAYTGAVTHLLNNISPSMRRCIFNSYFSRGIGMGYTHLRVPIGGCDFDLSPWAYNEYPENDLQLSNFTQLDRRELIRNAQFREIMELTGIPGINILAAYWGPPTWMKQKKEWKGGVDNQLLPQYYQTFANYHLKWLELMNQDGIDIWAISTGNEPVSAAKIKFQALSWNASDQAKWIAENLGPTLKNSPYSDVEIHGFDENRNLAPKYLTQMQKSYPAAFQYISAFEFHAYADKALEADFLDYTQNAFPDKQIWYTEMSFGAFFMTKHIGPMLGAWGRCERLAEILFENLCHATVGYLDWNLILNHEGGPNYVQNHIDAQIILSADQRSMYKQPTFFIMAHFSRFILPGSTRIESILRGRKTTGIKSIAFLRPDGKICVIAYNKDSKRSVNLVIRDKFKGAIKIKLKPKSINTIVYVATNDQSSMTVCPKRSKKC